jgi:molybdopterin-guanine dinucleotide biosynthesis protein A
MEPLSHLSRVAFLQAGGKSTRMGENKAFIQFSGQTLLSRALQTLAEVCAEVTIVGESEVFAGYGKVVSDIYPNCGPLGGIHAALASSSAALNVMLAVDMPFVTAGLLRFLCERASETHSLVTVPRTSRGLQPLCAVYRPDFARIAEQSLRARKFKIDLAFAGIPIHVVTGPELAAAGFSEQSFFNVNTPEDRRIAANLKP